MHPALIVSDPTLTLPGTVLIIPLTGAEHKRRGYEFHVEVTTEECPELDKDLIAKLSLATMQKVYAKLLKGLGVPKFIKEPQ